MAERTILFAGLSLGAAALAALLSSEGCAPTARDFGAGGGGEDGGAPCKPGDTAACYDGLDATRDKGLCKSGTRTCQPDGTFGACEGEVLPKPEDCKTPEDEDCNGVSEVCALATLWAGGYGVAGANNFVSALAADATGGVVLGGSLNGQVDFGGGLFTSTLGDDAFVARFDPMGVPLWSRQLSGATGDQGVRAVAVDASGAVYIGGSFSGALDLGSNYSFQSLGGDDVFVAKLSPKGDTLWALTGGDVNSEQLTAMALTSKGELLVAGNFSGKLSLGGGVSLTATMGSQDLFVFKLGADGAPVWGTSTSGMSFGTAHNLAVDASDDVYLAAQYTSSMTMGGKIFTSLGGADCFIARLSGATGGLVWGRTFGSPVFDRASGIAVDSKGTAYVGGSFGQSMTLDATTLTAMGAESIFVATLAADGKVVSAVPYGGGLGQGSAAFVKVDSKDNLVVGGYYNGAITFGGDVFMSMGLKLDALDMYVAKFDPAGKHLGSRSFGSDLLQAATALGLDSSDHVFLGGGTRGQLDFGTGPVGSMDMTVLNPVVVKMGP